MDVRLLVGQRNRARLIGAAACAGMLLLALVTETHAADSADRPLLRIEAGADVATTYAATDPAGRLLVSASYDKTVRLWSLPDLRPLGVLRPPIGAKADEGKLYTVAVSPNGRLAAVGGWSPEPWNDILVFDLQTRQVVQTLTGLPNVIMELAFSPDGLRLAAGLGGANGVRIWRVGDGSALMEDKSYVQEVSSVNFAPNGWLAAVSGNQIRLYDADGHLKNRAEAGAGRESYLVRFSHDGALLAVGFTNTGAPEVRDGTTLELRNSPDIRGIEEGSLAKVAWSAKGLTLYAGGGATANGKFPVFAWADGGRGPRTTVAAGFSASPVSILPLPDGRLAYTSDNGDIAVVLTDGSPLSVRRTAAGNLRGARGVIADPSRRFELSRDGAQVEWAFFDTEGRWLRFDVAGPDLAIGSAPQPGLVDWSVKTGGASVTDFESRHDPKLNGQQLPLDKSEWAMSAAVTPGRVLLGTSWYVRLFNAEGKRLWSARTPEAVFRVNLSPDGRLAVAALGDGTIRWYRMSDGAELLALFVTPDSQRWVAFTPSGYYAASPEGENLFGWHVNRGRERAADFFHAAQFREQFYRPDVIKLVLGTLDETKALQQADDARGKQTLPAMVTRLELPPVVTILLPKDNATVPSTGEARLRVLVRSPSGTPIRGLRVLANARPLPLASAQIGAPHTLSPPARGESAEENEIVLNLSAFAGSDVSLAVVAQSNGRESVPARLLMRVAPPELAAVPQQPRMPVLYGVLVGVSAYNQDSLRLKLAAKDARDFADTLRRQKEGGLYREVQLRVLVDAQVTRTAVLQALQWLERSTTQRDTAVLFLAGHGVNTEDREYFFLPPDAEFDNPEITGISATDLLRPLRPMAGRVLVFLDTCYGGALFGSRTRSVPDITNVLNEMLASNEGIVAFSATTGKTRAEERDDIPNGVFTYSLLRALHSGSATRREIRVNGLAEFLAEDVKRLTSGRQKAAFISPDGMPDVPIFFTIP